MTHSTKSHGGMAAQAARRDEQYVACNTCGQRHARIRFHAEPNYPYAEPEERITPLRFAGLVFFGLALWLVLGGFVWIVMAGAA